MSLITRSFQASLMVLSMVLSGCGNSGSGSSQPGRIPPQPVQPSDDNCTNNPIDVDGIRPDSSTRQITSREIPQALAQRSYVLSEAYYHMEIRQGTVRGPVIESAFLEIQPDEIGDRQLRFQCIRSSGFRGSWDLRGDEHVRLDPRTMSCRDSARTSVEMVGERTRRQSFEIRSTREAVSCFVDERNPRRHDLSIRGEENLEDRETYFIHDGIFEVRSREVVELTAGVQIITKAVLYSPY